MSNSRLPISFIGNSINGKNHSRSMLIKWKILQTEINTNFQKQQHEPKNRKKRWRRRTLATVPIYIIRMVHF